MQNIPFLPIHVCVYRYILEYYGIPVFTMHEIDNHGISYVIEKAIDSVNPG